ncbi:unnamed protein product [Symbiodinium sp. CCMP2592]|nr:unnamed protein product [Symbiodinium sp. CCMP2592]
MANYGQASAKRHVAWSNDADFIEGIVRHGGFLSVADRQAFQLSKLAHHYYDAKVGKIRYTGKSLLLPASGKYPAKFGEKIAELFRYSGDAAKLPGPKMACDVDWMKSDYELVKGLLPDNVQLESFGDLAQEVP